MNKILNVVMMLLLVSVAVSAAPVTVQDGTLNVSGKFWVNLTKLFVDAGGGDVGIGTNNPTAPLEVNGLIKAANWSNITIRQSQVIDLQQITDTNETTRFNALVATDCPGTNKTVGVDANGNIVCATDVDTDTDTQKTTNGFYLTNDSTTIYFNETKLNQTIDLRDDDTTYTNGTGISLSGNTFSIILSYFQGLFLELTDSFGGDVSGTYDNLQLRTDVVGDAELNTSEVTLNDLTNDAGFIKNNSDVNFTFVNATRFAGNGSGLSGVCLSDGTNCQASGGSTGNTSEEMQDAAWNMTFDNECIITIYDDTNNKTSLDVNKTCVFQNKYNGLSSDQLTGFWTGDGNAFDSSGHNHDGVLVGSVTYANDTQARFGRAFDVTANDVYVKAEHHASMVGNSTSIVAWIKPNTIAGGYGGIITKNDDASFRPFSCWQNNQNVEIWFSSGGGSGTVQLTASSVLPETNRWYHVICEYDAQDKNLSIFVDGILRATGSHGTGPDSPNNGKYPIIIGHRGNGSGHTQDFDGVIDEVMWWNRSLHWEEVQALYTRGEQFVPAQGISAGEPFGWASMSGAGTSATTTITLGAGASEDTASNHMSWNGTHFLIDSQGTYEIESNAYILCGTSTTYDYVFYKNGAALFTSAPVIQCNSAVDPAGAPLSWAGCLSSGDAISVVADSSSANAINFQPGSQVKMKRLDKNCY